MATLKTQVYFEVYDYQAMRQYCKEHNLTLPVLHSTEPDGDNYTSTFGVWEQLYRNLPYCVTGCFCM